MADCLSVLDKSALLFTTQFSFKENLQFSS